MTEMKLLLHLVLLTVYINVIISHPTNHIVKNQFLLLVSDQVVCPDNSTTCADHNTCCKLRSGGYGCCPMPNAVCCSDGEHCCPNDYACTTDGRCTDNQNKRPVDVMPVVQTAELSSLQNSKASSNGMCTDRVCNAKQTCCLYSNSTTDSIGCCDMYEAVCCGDQTHCCPKNYRCGQNNGKCYPNDLHTTIDTPFPASSIKPQWLLNGIICGDDISECPDNDTCCKIVTTNKYACCPMPHAVCCAATCCPNGYTCEDNGTCGRAVHMES